MIIEGEVEILGETPAGEFIVAVVGRNELQGEMGVITNTPRGATVRAKTPVRALRIAADVFLRLLTENPGCALHVMRELSARVVAGNARVAAALRDVETLKAQLQGHGGCRPRRHARRDATARRCAARRSRAPMETRAR